MKGLMILILGGILAQVPALAQNAPVNLCKTIDNTKLDQAGQMPFKTCGSQGTIRILLPSTVRYEKLQSRALACEAKTVSTNAGVMVVDLSFNLGNRAATTNDFCGLLISQGEYGHSQISFAGYLDQDNY